MQKKIGEMESCFKEDDRITKLSEWYHHSKKIFQTRYNFNKGYQYLEELSIRKIKYDLLLNNSYKIGVANFVLGKYYIVGSNAIDSDSGYIGVLEVFKDKDRCYGRWTIEEEDVQEGYGFFKNNILTLGFKYEREGVFFTGVISYEFLADDIIIGHWTEEASNTVGIELGRKLDE